MWAGSGVKGHRAAKGAERAGGGWRLPRLFIFGGRVTEARTRVRRVRHREKSGGRSQHAQPGDGCGEWLGVPAWAQTPSLAPRFGLLSQVAVSGPESTPPALNLRGPGPPPRRALTVMEPVHTFLSGRLSRPPAPRIAFFSGPGAWSRAGAPPSRPGQAIH